MPSFFLYPFLNLSTMLLLSNTQQQESVSSVLSSKSNVVSQVYSEIFEELDICRFPLPTADVLFTLLKKKYF